MIADNFPLKPVLIFQRLAVRHSLWIPNHNPDIFISATILLINNLSYINFLLLLVTPFNVNPLNVCFAKQALLLVNIRFRNTKACDWSRSW